MRSQIICGVGNVKQHPIAPYSDNVCRFLDTFSVALRQDREAKLYPDVQTFAFWIRKANIQKKKGEFENHNHGMTRIGKGIVFHIAPSNVPVNCMFTYVFGLLAGNSNIVRIPTREFIQVECMCRILNQIFEMEEYSDIRDMTSIIRYEKNKEITDWYSSYCDMRVIWGGDETIQEIRLSPLPARSTEITFADRYSFGVVSAAAWEKTEENDKHRFAEAFYNDTYQMDQNACSTPHIIFWMKDKLDNNKIKEIQNDFWNCIYLVAKKYDLADIKVSEKYTLLCEKAMTMSCVREINKYENLLFVCSLKDLSDNLVTDCRGKYGLFYQSILEDYNELCKLNDKKVQTCAYFGIDKNELRDYLTRQGFVGIDRIVPFGATLDIDVVWDGYDLINQMSRIIG